MIQINLDAVYYPYSDKQLVQLAVKKGMLKKELDDLIGIRYSKAYRVSQGMLNYSKDERERICKHLLDASSKACATVNHIKLYDKHVKGQDVLTVSVVYASQKAFLNTNKVYSRVLEKIQSYYTDKDLLITKINIEHDYSQLP